MLRPPHTRYNRLFIYYLDRCRLPLIDDTDFIGTWVEDDGAVLFFHQPKDDLIGKICTEAAAKIIYQADLDYRDWEAGIDIVPFATRATTVRPVWENRLPADQKRQEIILDPSVIFGSGFHATTRLCLETLERLLTSGEGSGITSMIDLGTGTGLLAIAAAKHGVGRVTAVDCNPLACAVAEHNIALNNCRGQVKVAEADLRSKTPDLSGYDLVVANLYKGLLLSLFEQECFWRAKRYLISGFISGMEGDLLAALPVASIKVLHRDGRDRWRLWLLQNG